MPDGYLQAFQCFTDATKEAHELKIEKTANFDNDKDLAERMAWLDGQLMAMLLIISADKRQFDEAQAELTRLAQAPTMQQHTTWNWGQTLTHLAQSIEYSMSGFPEAKSALFQRTVGATAFNVFAWRGRISHPLDDPIPGAPLSLPTSEALLIEARTLAADDAALVAMIDDRLEARDRGSVFEVEGYDGQGGESWVAAGDSMMFTRNYDAATDAVSTRHSKVGAMPSAPRTGCFSTPSTSSL